MNLKNEQLEAVEKLKTLKVGALFMEAGVGKTRTALELVNQTDADYLLYLAPVQVIKDEEKGVKNEFKEVNFNSIPYDFCGIESLSSSHNTYMKFYQKLMDAQKPFVICDESLKIKNHNAMRTKRITNLGELAEYRLILNGTPLSRDLLDIWSQFEFLSPKILNMSFTQFKNSFVEFTTMKKRIGDKLITREWFNGYHNVDYLNAVISPYIYECSLDLEVDKQYINVDYEVEADLKDKYNELKAKFLELENVMKWNNNIFLAMTQKMQHSYCLAKEKFKYISQYLKGHKDEKVLIVTKFIDSRRALELEFPDLKILSYGKHSYGLNLQDYNTIIFFDKTFDYGKQEQIEHRIYRVGQQSKIVKYITLNGNLPLERMILTNIEKKSKLLKTFKEKIKSDEDVEKLL